MTGRQNESDYASGYSKSENTPTIPAAVQTKVPVIPLLNARSAVPKPQAPTPIPLHGDHMNFISV